MTDKEIIKRLEQENAELKAEKEKLIEQLVTYNHFEESYNELKAELQNFKDMAKKGLDEFKDVGGCWGCGLQLQLNQDMEDIKQLKAENERLKAECDMYKTFYRAKHDDIKGILFKYRQTLQEIKDYLNTLSGIDNDFVNTETYLRIIDLITKAEEE